MAWIRYLQDQCPNRSHPSGGTVQFDLDVAQYAQDITWQTLAHAHIVMALICNAETLEIFAATLRCVQVFGDAVDTGKVIYGLVAHQTKVMYLKRAIAVNQGLIEGESTIRPLGFGVKPIGTVELVTKDSLLINANLTICHLPAEQALNKEAALIVLIAPQNGGTGHRSSVHSNLSDDGLRNRRHYQQSDLSSIRPSDSASNVM